MLRIRKTRWKIVYIVVGVLVLNVLSLLLFPGLPRPVDAVLGILFSGLLYFGGTRSFRGHDEPVEPPRVWWRMTSRPRAGFVIGSFLAVSFASDIFFAISTPPDLLLTYVLNAIFDASLAFLYYHSSIRLQRTPRGLSVSTPTSR
jgi:hypothetical protein